MLDDQLLKQENAALKQRLDLLNQQNTQIASLEQEVATMKDALKQYQERDAEARKVPARKEQEEDKK